MPKIKASSIEELKARVNIYDVVSAYVSLKKSGSSYKGLSPFTTLWQSYQQNAEQQIRFILK